MALRDLLTASAQYIANKTKEAVNWYRKAIENLGTRGRTSAPPTQGAGGAGGGGDDDHGLQLVGKPEMGKLYLYYYDAKLKDKLPFYDQYPLTIMIHPYNDGFLGLNLHYLPPLARVQLLTAMYDTRTNPNMDDNTKLNITYGMLKAASTRYSGYDQCIKRYLYSHVRSSFHEVHPAQWEKVAILNLQKWVVNPSRRRGNRSPY